MFVNAMHAMQHLCYECKTDWELILTKYVVSIAGLVDINRIEKTEYVVSIAGLVDINQNSKQQNMSYPLRDW